mgnify:CR=1 FL=1
MKDGWFVGNFSPTAFSTNLFEVCYKTHQKGELWDTHYHEFSTEINLLISGKMTINGIELNAGDIFTIEPYYIAAPIFLEDCTLIIIKTPSIPGDKKII